MAWVTGPHAEAPQGVICYPTEEHNIMTWYEPEGGEAPPPPPPPQEETSQ